MAAVVLTATDDNNTLRANNDSTAVDTVQPNGGTLAIKEARTSQGNSRIGYFKFDLSPASSAVDGDTATFSVTLNGTTGTSFNITVFALNQGTTGYDWTEDTITWNSSPAISTDTEAHPNYINLDLVTAVGSFTIPNTTAAGTSFETTFNGWEAFRQEDDSLTFIFVATMQGSVGPTLSIVSSENAVEDRLPTLTIVPEPGSAVLVTSAALLFLVRRRSR